MIETAKQTREALEEIKKLTEWTNSRTAKKVGIFIGTLDRILSGEIKNPTPETMEKVENELSRVREIS